jgi:hypothetical protein
MEHCLHQTVIALRICDRIGVGERDRAATYYTGLLANVYCHADAHEQAEWFGDDIAVKHGAYETGVFEFLRMIGASQKGLRRARKVARFPGQGIALVKSMSEARTRLASGFATRIGLDEITCRALRETYEQWDGEAARRSSEARRSRFRRGSFSSPTSPRRRIGGTASTRRENTCASVAASSSTRPWPNGADLDAALEAMADLVDMKSPQLAGHSRGVANLAAEGGPGLRPPQGRADRIAPSRVPSRPRPARRLQRDLGQTGPAERPQALSQPVDRLSYRALECGRVVAVAASCRANRSAAGSSC